MGFLPLWAERGCPCIPPLPSVAASLPQGGSEPAARGKGYGASGSCGRLKAAKGNRPEGYPISPSRHFRLARPSGTVTPLH